MQEMNPQQEAVNMEGPTGELLTQLIAEAVEYIHDKARDQVVEKLTASENTSETIAAITYKLSRGLLEKHKEQGLAIDIEMDLAMGLATEIIDMQLEILERIRPDLGAQAQKLREDALLRTMMIHAEQMEGNPDAKADAEVMMRSFIQDGTADTAFNYINKRAAQEGLNTDDMIRTGNKAVEQMVGGGPAPVAEGVQQGLMGGGNG